MNCSCLRFYDLGSSKHLAALAKSLNIEIQGLDLIDKFYSRIRQRTKNQIDEEDEDLNSSLVLGILAPTQAIIYTTQIYSIIVAEPINEP